MSYFTSSESNHIYYNLKFSNIYDGLTTKSIKFAKRDDTSTILDKQSDYEMAIQSFRLNLTLPLFLFPIAEGFVSYLPTENQVVSITQATQTVITGSINHGFNTGDAVRIKGVQGMTSINGSFTVANVISTTAFSIDVNSTKFPAYTSGGTIQKTNDDINRTSWGICLRHAGVDYAETVYYVSDKNTTTDPSFIPLTPKANNGIQDYSTFYYYSYSFDAVCKAINNALQLATTAINTVTPGTLDYPPIFEYNNSKFSLIWDYKMESNNVEMFCNQNLLNYFQGFRTIAYGQDQPNFKDYQFVIENDWNNQYAYAPQGLSIPNWTNKTTPVSPQFLRFEQEWVSTYKFDEIVSIIIISDYIKCRPEYYPRIGNPNSISSVGRSNDSFNTGTLNIIASFDLIDDSNGVGWREVLHYQPFIYKFVDLISDDPLQKIDARLLLETSRGNLLDAYIPIGSQSNIRFLFRQKVQY